MSPKPVERPSAATGRSGVDEGGFTLLEVLVALVIAGLAIAALLQGSLGGLQSTRVAGHYDEALVRARSRLDAIGHGSRITSGVQEGDDGGGYHWRSRVVALAVEPAAAGSAAPNAVTRPALYEIAVGISWGMDGGTRTVSLQSQRVGIAAGPP